MAYSIPTPPTFANPVVVNPQTGQNQFNPIWLQWFLVLAQNISSISEGRIRDIVPVLSTGEYVPSSGTNNVFVFLWGGGGPGGSSAATSPTEVSAGGGGGAGGFTFALLTSGFANQILTVGGPGQATTFTTMLAAPGGAGASGTALSVPGFVQGGGGGSTSGGLVNGSGQNGTPGIVIAPTAGMGGGGANAAFGSGGLSALTSGIGNNALGYAAGGGGAYSAPNSLASAGGTGAPGLALLMELS